MVTLRFGEYLKFVDGKVKEIYLIIDILDLMNQVGICPLDKSMGMDNWWPKPSNNKGIILNARESAETQKSLKLHARWIDEIKNFPESNKDVSSLQSDGYLHPRYMQYASFGFGATRGAYGFKQYYLKPLFLGFSQRQMGHYDLRLAENKFLTAKGWSCFVGYHSNKFMGREKTGKQVKFRKMEWWRRAGETFKESWVLIDTPDLLRQVGIDVFAEMRNFQTKDLWL